MKGVHPHSHLIITGASSGLGAALAKQYATPGATLSLSGRDRERLDSTAQMCRELGADVDAVRLDVTDSGAMRAWLEARDSFRPADLIYANAGVGGKSVLASRAGEDLETTRRIFEVNTMGVLNTVVPLAPRMCERGRGQIVIISSMAASIALPQSPAYCGSKAAVTAYGEAMRRLLAPAGVKLTIVHPGFVDTPMSASLPYVLPLLWTADRAAAYIVAGVARGRRRIDFPLRFRLALGAAGFLPTRMLDAILARSMKMAGKSH